MFQGFLTDRGMYRECEKSCTFSTELSLLNEFYHIHRVIAITKSLPCVNPQFTVWNKGIDPNNDDFYSDALGLRD